MILISCLNLFCILYSSCHRHWIVPLVILVSSTRMYNLHSVLIHDMFLLSGSMHLSLEVLLTVGADEEVSLMETERIRLLADYIK
jgi:hypothetical protein